MYTIEARVSQGRGGMFPLSQLDNFTYSPLSPIHKFHCFLKRVVKVSGPLIVEMSLVSSN